MCEKESAIVPDFLAQTSGFTREEFLKFAAQEHIFWQNAVRIGPDSRSVYISVGDKRDYKPIVNTPLFNPSASELVGHRYTVPVGTSLRLKDIAWLEVGATIAPVRFDLEKPYNARLKIDYATGVILNLFGYDPNASVYLNFANSNLALLIHGRGTILVAGGYVNNLIIFNHGGGEVLYRGMAENTRIEQGKTGRTFVQYSKKPPEIIGFKENVKINRQGS